MNKEELKELIADIIYSADWEISGRLYPNKDITEFYMIDEDDTVEEIIEAVKEFLGRQKR